MFRSFIINQMTQSSTWFGLIVILCALLLPRMAIMFAGILIMVTDDARIQKMFAGLKKYIEQTWTK